MVTLESLLTEVAACRLCEPCLPLGLNPILQCSATARILIAGQAPGSRVHTSGIPFDDPSGDRLRDWMGINREIFYNAAQIAILPMGFCYPGTGKSSDLPPRPECAIQWRARLLGHMQQIKLTLVMGQYAQRYHLASGSRSLTGLVRSWQDYWPSMVPLPHPSPRNNRWLKANPWFEAELLPALKTRVKKALTD